MAIDFTIMPAFGFEQITAITTTAKGFVSPAGTRCVIQAQDTALRWRDDGTSPTTTVGMVLAAGSDMYYEGPMDAIKFIRDGASGTGVVNASFY